MRDYPLSSSAIALSKGFSAIVDSHNCLKSSDRNLKPHFGQRYPIPAVFDFLMRTFVMLYLPNPFICYATLVLAASPWLMPSLIFPNAIAFITISDRLIISFVLANPRKQWSSNMKSLSSRPFNLSADVRILYSFLNFLLSLAIGRNILSS